MKSKSVKECGTTITLKPSQMAGGAHKISLTDRQIKHFNDALMKRRGVQIDFSKAAIANMIKSGGIFPLLAAIPAMIAAAAPAVAKAAALGAVGTAAGMVLKKATGQGYQKRGLFRMLAAMPALMAAAAPEVIRAAAAGKATGRGY